MVATGKPQKVYHLEGHAIISCDGKIADLNGVMPQALINDADFAQFQAALDRAKLVILGSQGHNRHPAKGRARLVLTSKVKRLQPDPDVPKAFLWNPSAIAFADVLKELRVSEGIIAVTGGQRVFDHFLQLGFESFKLAEVHDTVLPDGIACFSHAHPRVALSKAGLVPSKPVVLDGPHPTTLTHWRRADAHDPSV